jgi:hypothetical protein
MFSGTAVKLPKALYERARAAAVKAGYSSIEEFVQHAVENELARIEKAGEKAGDKEIALQQLKGLGYLE